MNRILNFSLFFLWLSCQVESDSYMRPSIQNTFNWQKTKDLTFWQNFNDSISFRDQASLHSFQKLIQNKKMVMVSYNLNSALDHYVKQSPHTYFWKNSPTTQTGYALFEIKSPAYLDQIANLAHDSNRTCGNVELITANLTQQTTTITEPIISDTLKSTTINNLLSKIDINNIKTSIQDIQSEGTRYHTTVKGINYPTKLKGIMENNLPDNASVSLIAHGTYSEQNSVIGRIPGTKDPEKIIILGAHLDTTNKDRNFADAPGADDNASGLAILIEIMRVIKENNLTFDRTLEFHAYGAEEVGLVGSKLIAEKYQQENKQIVSMLQLDMVAWSSQEDNHTIYIMDNDTNINLRRSAKNILNNYLSGNFVETTLTKGTSDHRSWHSLGFPTLFVHENPHDNNPHIHSSRDIFNNLTNFTLAERFAKFSFAFVAHYAGLKGDTLNHKDSYEQWSHDLKLAIFPNLSISDQTFFVVAASVGTNKIEVCQTTNFSALSCNGTIQNLENTEEKNNRVFFSLSLENTFYKNDQTYMIRSYDSKDKILDVRTIKLRK